MKLKRITILIILCTPLTLLAQNINFCELLNYFYDKKMLDKPISYLLKRSDLSIDTLCEKEKKAPKIFYFQNQTFFKRYLETVNDTYLLSIYISKKNKKIKHVTLTLSLVSRNSYIGERLIGAWYDERIVELKYQPKINKWIYSKVTNIKSHTTD